MARSLEGLLVLNVLFLLAGTGILWGARGWRSWSELASLSGVAYVAGLAAVCVIGTLVPILGGALSTAAILLLVFAVAATGIAAGVILQRPLPGRPRLPRLPRTPYVLAPVGLALLSAAMLAAWYRSARILPLTSWDAWAFWMTKAKAIYYFGGLDAGILRTLAWPSYPMLVPTLAAMNFRFMGSADTTTLAVQWWLLGVGLVAAGAGLLQRIAPALVAWLFLVTALSIPEFDRRLLERTADWPLDIFFALAALALLGWIVTGESWRLWVYGLTLAAVLATKREGQLLAACLVVGGIAAAGWRSRRSWLSVAGVAALAYAVNIPWRIWWTSHHLAGDAPPGGLVHGTISGIGQIGPAFHLVLKLLFAYHFWLGATPIALVAAVLCVGRANRAPAVFFLVTFVLGFVGWAWENWAYSSLIAITPSPGINPTARTVGSLVFLSIVTAPVLIGQLLSRSEVRLAAEPVPAS
jgi:hypothetical protein